MIALDDFAEGAMENWGLITFRDAVLLYNQNGSTEKTKEHIALVICHEMAHQVHNKIFIEILKLGKSFWIRPGLEPGPVFWLPSKCTTTVLSKPPSDALSKYLLTRK